MIKNIENIRNDRYEKTYKVDDTACTLLIEDAFYGDWKGQTELLDKTVVDDMCKDIIKAISKHESKYNPLPVQISIRHQEAEAETQSASHLANIADPKYKLDDVALPKETREQIEVTLSAVRNRKQLSEKWGLSEYCMKNRAVILNFYGQAGTGKSMTAEAIAAHLGKKVFLVNYSELESKYVGETPKNIKRVFADAADTDAVLVFDEADSFLSSRLTNITQSADYGVNITRSVMLMELEHFDGIVIFTTNLIQNYDTAFKRRILASIEFGLPDEEARIQIWKLHMGKKLPVADDVSAEILAKQYENLSGADIKDIVFYAAVYALDKAKHQVELADFDKAYQYIVKRYEES